MIAAAPRPIRAAGCVHAGDVHEGGPVLLSVFRAEDTVVLHLLIGPVRLRLDFDPEAAVELGTQLCAGAREIQYKT